VTRPRPVVLDASVAIAIIRREAVANAARATVARWISVGRPLVVPSHFWLEVANVLFRRHRWNGEEVLTAVHDLEELGLETVEPGPGARLLMIDAAERFGLSSYDAQYIAVAEELDGDLATFDAALAAAAGPRSIAIGPAGRVSEIGPVYERTATWPRYTAVSAYLAALRRRVTRDEAVAP
jgi:predicted nucleic acid-binding protein